MLLLIINIIQLLYSYEKYNNEKYIYKKYNMVMKNIIIEIMKNIIQL